MTHSLTARLLEMMGRARLGALVYDDTGTQVWEATGKGPALAFDVRGWGWIQKEPEPEAMQDARGKLVAEAINALPALLRLIDIAKEAHDVMAESWPDRPITIALAEALAAVGGGGEHKPPIGA